MKEQMKELQKLKGIGEVLSRRLVESSYDTIAKVAGAGRRGLSQETAADRAQKTEAAERRRVHWSRMLQPGQAKHSLLHPRLSGRLKRRW